MGQVPHYLVIGNGRVARHVLRYFSLSDIAHSHWHRGMDAAALRGLAQKATHTLLLVSDGAIADVAALLGDADVMKVHFSGALSTDAAYGAHPLMTFGPDLYTLEKYKTIPFVVDDDAPDFSTLLPGFSNPHTYLPRAQKGRYHAMCVMAANYSCILWQRFFSVLEHEFGMPPDSGHPFLQQQTENLLRDHVNALTGPLARGDEKTIAKNLEGLADDPYRRIYEAFVTVYKEEHEKP